MTKKFDELNDAFNISGDIIPTSVVSVGTISLVTLKASFNSSKFLVIR